MFYASCNCSSDTRLSVRKTALITVTNVSDDDWRPLLSSARTLSRPPGKSRHHFRICWTNITFASYTAGLGMVTGSVLWAQRNRITVYTSFVSSRSVVPPFSNSTCNGSTTLKTPVAYVWQNEPTYDKATAYYDRSTGIRQGNPCIKHKNAWQF